ncbi:MAG: NRDE family protein [Desulfobacterales bacterium]|nr:NRDE family protein [Desulfobacterales bacterium]
MCLILLSYDMHADNSLIVAANRDEYYDRPTGPLAFWREAPHVLAGRDIRGGGTWLGITCQGRIAALTNFRDPSAIRGDAPSRGLLVRNFLEGTDSPPVYLERIRKNAHKYNPFSLLLGDRSGLFYHSNRNDEIRQLESGLYGLSNHLLDTPWPKVQKGKDSLENLIKTKKRVSPEDIFDILSDRSFPPGQLLPDTGVGSAWERLLSPVFITSRIYGTRSAAALIVNRTGRITVAERSFPPRAEGIDRYSTRTFRLMLT